MKWAKKLGLGTAQWGMRYGVANHTGVATADDVATILRLAQAAGVSILDTAPVYGAAEDVLGAQDAAGFGFEIITKTLPLRGLKVDVAMATQRIYERFLLSIKKLGIPSAYGLLVHHAADLLGPNGERIWNILSSLRSEGQVRKIGCSLYHPSELKQLLQRYELDLVQIPFNLYDQRFLRSGALEAARAHKVEIHARSVFLQGLLLTPQTDLPAHFNAIRAHHERFFHECRVVGVTPLQAALGFVTQNPWIDKAIVGCESSAQCREILAAVGLQRTGSEWGTVLFRLSMEDERYINPGRWPGDM